VSVCLDSCAILAWLDGEEPALSRVDEPIASGNKPTFAAMLLVIFGDFPECRPIVDRLRERMDGTTTSLELELAELPKASTKPRNGNDS
jgi:hypothetical protein